MDVEPVPKRERKLRRKPADPGPAFRQLTAVQLSGSVGHTLAQMRQAFEADEDEAGGAPMAAHPPYDGAARRMRAAQEPASEALEQSDAESGELVASPPRGGKEAAADVSSEGASGAVEGVERHVGNREGLRMDSHIERGGNHPASGEGVRMDSHIEGEGQQPGSGEEACIEDAEERSEQRRKHSTGEKRKKHRSDRSDSRGRERKESRRQDKEPEGGRKHKKRRRRSESRSISPSERRHRHESSRGAEASSGSDSGELDRMVSRRKAGNRTGSGPAPAVPVAAPQVSDALRARVRAMLESVAQK